MEKKVYCKKACIRKYGRTKWKHDSVFIQQITHVYVHPEPVVCILIKHSSNSDEQAVREGLVGEFG